MIDRYLFKFGGSSLAQKIPPRVRLWKSFFPQLNQFSINDKSENIDKCLYVLIKRVRVVV
jgi:hypothetical protein